MEYKKITNFSNKTGDIARFTTKKWVEIFDFSNGTYNPRKDIRFKTSQLRNDMCDFNDAYVKQQQQTQIQMLMIFCMREN